MTKTTGVARGNRRISVLELARGTVDRLTPEYVTPDAAANFDRAAQTWSARRRSLRPGPVPAPDASSRVGIVETGAMLAALLAAQAAQDALRESLSEKIKSWISRLFGKEGKDRNPTIDTPTAAELDAAPVGYSPEQLRGVKQAAYEQLIRAGYPHPVAEAFANATVAELAMRTASDDHPDE